VTSIIGHGLGALATLHGVGTTEISDGSIADVDISGAAAIATSKLSGAVTSISGHGLGSLATLSTVGAAQITDGSIADDDVSNSAAIATSKLSGAVTSISGHGLGALATVSAVGTSEITDGTIADADVSATAAIATSKLAGAVTSISGHGLGSLATLSTIGSAEISDGSVSSSDIADGTIANGDVSGTAEIATSKLSGAVTSISGHGLGALASLSAVGSTEIVNGSITDADVSGSAEIATSKLSGAITSISGHGLGSLATLSSVDSSQITNGTIVDADISGTAAISSTKISFAAASISGNAIDGGIISNFQSMGIDDNATGVAMTLNSSGNVGIGTTAPNSVLQLAGALSVPVAVKSAAYTLTASDSFVLANAAGSSFTITLPSAVGTTGRQYTVKKIDSSSNAVLIAAPSGQTVDGGTSVSLGAQWQSITVISDGINWFMAWGSSTNSVSLPSQCSSYNLLNDSTRAVTYGSGSACDSGLAAGWYRFNGGSMPTSVPSTDRCGTQATGWFNGTNPATAGQNVSGTACFNWSGNSCNWSASIQVTNCNGYYVYYLNPSPNCNLRYCYQ
jgi:hypothetical protein